MRQWLFPGRFSYRIPGNMQREESEISLSHLDQISTMRSKELARGNKRFAADFRVSAAL